MSRNDYNHKKVNVSKSFQLKHSYRVSDYLMTHIRAARGKSPARQEIRSNLDLTTDLRPHQAPCQFCKKEVLNWLPAQWAEKGPTKNAVGNLSIIIGDIYVGTSRLNADECFLETVPGSHVVASTPVRGSGPILVMNWGYWSLRTFRTGRSSKYGSFELVSVCEYENFVRSIQSFASQKAASLTRKTWRFQAIENHRFLIANGRLM
jgi:hypothetical protein